LKSVVEQTCIEALYISAITNCHLTAEENERITNERDSNQGVAAAILRGSHDRVKIICGRITKTFDDRMKDLQAFKEEHGHCNVTLSKSHRNKYQSLASWCNSVKQSYKNIKQGGRSPSYKLSDANIQCLERMGFEWSLRVGKGISFDRRIKDLQAFKEERGHCNVSHSKSEKI
jgi:hypothetical protein